MTQNGTTNAASLDALINMTDTFDEILPEPKRISIIEFRDEEIGEMDEEGQPIIIRRPYTRIALINTYVPMKILHRMMASQERLKRIQAMAAQGHAQESGDGQQAMLAWMLDQVLEVWKLTEPRMTAEKLAEGLSYQKVFGLFGIFFGDLLKQMNGQ